MIYTDVDISCVTINFNQYYHGYCIIYVENYLEILHFDCGSL